MFMGVALLDYGSLPYFVGTFKNFLAATNLTDGTLPGCVTPAGPAATLYHAKPLIVQAALLAARAARDTAQFAPDAPAMRALLRYWSSRADAPTGLPRWHDQLESGADNLVFSACPSPLSPECWVAADALSLVAPDAAVWLSRELTAYALFVEAWRGLGAGGDWLWARDWRGEAAGARAAAAALGAALGALFACDAPAPRGRGAGCFWGALNATTRAPIRARTWAAALPAWAGLANASAAAAALDSAALPDLASKWGLRSTASSDARFNNDNIIDPYSNWRGPVWVNAAYLHALALRSNGRAAAAAAEADAVVATLAADLRATGTWHEAYDSTTGAGLAAPGFLSWDTLGARIQADAYGGVDPFALE